MNQEPFVIERTFDAPVEKVWKAITDRDEMKNWYFDLEEFKPEIGFEFEFIGGEDGKEFVHLCKVVEVQPGRKVSYTWAYEGYPGKSTVTFELFPEGEGTRLKLTHAGLETFPADIKDFAKENFEKGWTEIIGTSLKNYLES